MPQDLDMSLLAGQNVLRLEDEHGPVVTTRQVTREREEQSWMLVRSAKLSGKILTGTLVGIEESESGTYVAVLRYGEYRVVLPLSEMLIINDEIATDTKRQQVLASAMLGCEVDFLVKGIDTATKSIVGSRKEAMMRKREMFYFRPGKTQVKEGCVVQARVIAVSAKVIRVEVFGVETSIISRDLFWDWVADASECYNVGDRVFARVTEVQGDAPENLVVKVEAKSLTRNASADNITQCKVQGRYVGVVTDVRHGTVYLRLSNSVNALALNCLDRRAPGKDDVASFVVTRIDVERALALGIITKIIKQNF